MLARSSPALLCERKPDPARYPEHKGLIQDAPRRIEKMIAQMPVPERIRIAKKKTQRVVDHLHYLLELHENNAIVLYSSTLSRQIPTSFAANAFRAPRKIVPSPELCESDA
jgi:hypothetical protein